jgi:hypothetical protein
MSGLIQLILRPNPKLQIGLIFFGYEAGIQTEQFNGRLYAPKKGSDNQIYCFEIKTQRYFKSGER